LFLSLNSHAGPSVTPESIAFSKEWLKLLHYQKGVFGGYESIIDGGGFFLAPNGKKDPLAEFQATVQAFSVEGIELGLLKQHPQCAFPARFRFLKEKLSLEISERNCTEFTDWKQGLNAESVTVVFSSAYPNNPASMFGHTFLRLNTQGKRTHSDLLDYGANFSAAIPPDENAMKFALWGLFGGYSGIFQVSPYYMKVNEYNHQESRDLWEYDLNLGPPQVARLIEHLWELMATAGFDYFFLDENCSYQLLALIQAAQPDWDLTPRSPVYVLPADTIKVLAEQKGAVTDVKFRPSSRKQMLQKRAVLDAEELKQFGSVIDEKSFVSEIKSSATSEALIAYYRYTDAQKSVPASQKLRDILVHRSKQGAAASRDLPDADAVSRPDLGHYSTSWGLSTRISRQEKRVLGLLFKPALHDLLNEDLGYEPYSQIDILNFSIEYQFERSRLLLDEVKWVETTSLYPWDFTDHKYSWRASTRLERLRGLSCDICYAMRLDGELGFAFEPWNKRLLFYGLGGLGADLSSAFAKTLRAGPVLMGGGIFQFFKHHKMQLEARMDADVLRNFSSPFQIKAEVNQSYAFNPAWDLRLTSFLIPKTSRETRGDVSLSLGLHYYY